MSLGNRLRGVDSQLRAELPSLGLKFSGLATLAADDLGSVYLLDTCSIISINGCSIMPFSIMPCSIVLTCRERLAPVGIERFFCRHR